MKKLLKKFKNAQAKISIQTYKRPRLFVILTMVLINVAILLVAAFIGMIIDPGFTSYLDALINGSVKWMLTPNAVLNIENAQTMALAVGVLIIGMILFSGVIIALTTNLIKDYFAKKDSGSGTIHLENHIVIINWNNKVPELVADLLYVRSRDVTLMILADVDKTYAEKQIKNAIKKTKTQNDNMANLNVLVKRGDALNKTDLHDISIKHADAILIMNKDIKTQSDKALLASDLDIIKIILSLGQVTFDNKVTIVAEVKKEATKARITTLKKVVHHLRELPIIPICFDRRLGQIMAQTIIEKDMEDVYLSLFSFDGSEVYKVNNHTIDSALKNLTHGIPIMKEDDGVYVVARDNHVKTFESEQDIEMKSLKIKKQSEKVIKDLIIVGNNNKRHFILESFKAYETLHKSEFFVKSIEYDDLKHAMQENIQDNNQVSYLLLSDETQVEGAIDSDVINALIELEEAYHGKDTHIIVELLDPKNDSIVKDFNIENTIISNKIISLLLSKLALFPETANFYEHLLTIDPNHSGDDNQAMMIKPVNTIISDTLPLHFVSVKSLVKSLYEASNKKYMIVGIMRDDSMKIFEGDLTNQEVTLVENDYVIIMKL